MGMVEIDGDLYDEETGEYAGSANPGWLPSVLETEEDLLNYMHLLLDAETRLLAERKKYASVLANIETMVKRHESKVKYMRTMYEKQAGTIALSLLPRDKDGNLKTKTYRSPWGKVSARDTKPSVKVTESSLAVDYAKWACPEAIKTTQTVLVSAIPDDLKMRLVEEPSLAEAYGFSVNPGGDSISITTLAKEDANADR